MTGRYNWRTELQSGVLNGYSESLIAKDWLTVAAMLKQQVYTTACIGKWKPELCADSGGWSNPTPNSREAKGLPNTQLYTQLYDVSTPGAKQANDAEIQIRKRVGAAAETRKAPKTK